jgi:hypothetical protein
MTILDFTEQNHVVLDFSGNVLGAVSTSSSGHPTSRLQTRQRNRNTPIF